MTQQADTSTYDLDLDTLAESKKTVKIGGKVISFDPPALEDLIEVAKLGSQLQKLQKQSDSGELDADQMGDVMDKLKNGLTGIVPELKDFKLNLKQLMALINLFVESAQPADDKALKAAGVSLDTDQKKTA